MIVCDILILIGPDPNLGTDALLATLLLSKCDFLIKPRSAVSEFAVYLQPRLANASFDFSIKDHPRPHWGNLSCTATQSGMKRRRWRHQS